MTDTKKWWKDKDFSLLSSGQGGTSINSLKRDTTTNIDLDSSGILAATSKSAERSGDGDGDSNRLYYSKSKSTFFRLSCNFCQEILLQQVSPLNLQNSKIYFGFLIYNEEQN